MKIAHECGQVEYPYWNKSFMENLPFETDNKPKENEIRPLASEDLYCCGKKIIH